MPVRRKTRSRKTADPYAESRAELERLRAAAKPLTKKQTEAAVRKHIRRLKQLIACKDRPKSETELNAYRRQLDDLQNGHKRGLVWDEAEARRAVDSFKLLHHYKGRQAGKPFVLEPWQEEGVVAPLFGWFWGKAKAKGGRRRFRTAYIEEPRKNGKTALAAGLIYKGFLYDDEPGPEIFTLAGSEEQADTLFDKNVKKLAPLVYHELLKYTESQIVFRDGEPGIVQLLSSKDSSAHSYDPHFFVLDELHVQPNRKLWEAMVTGQGARENPLAIAITTAGWDRSSLCWEMHEDVRQMLDPEHPTEDDAFFGFIAALDEDDDYTDPANWPKANPNYGITVTEAYYEDQVAKAKRSPGKANEIRQLNFGEWTQGEIHWINMDEWDAAARDFDDDYLLTLPCWAGFDIGDKRDLSGWTFTFWDAEEDLYIWKAIAWAPAESVSERADRDRSFVKRWIEQHHVRAMPGKGTDEKIVARDIAAVIRKYDVQQFAYDPSGTVALVFAQLEEEHGVDVLGDEGIGTEFLQSFPNFSPVMNEFSTLLLDGRFAHDGNPLLRWQASNLVVKKNHKDQIMCDKAKSSEKIDNMVAGFMGLALAWEAEDETEQPQPYRGTLTL